MTFHGEQIGTCFVVSDCDEREKKPHTALHFHSFNFLLNELILNESAEQI